jgi:hypothetical protein
MDEDADDEESAESAETETTRKFSGSQLDLCQKASKISDVADRIVQVVPKAQSAKKVHASPSPSSNSDPDTNGEREKKKIKMTFCYHRVNVQQLRPFLAEDNSHKRGERASAFDRTTS